MKNGGWSLPTHIAAIALISIPFMASNGCVNRGQRAPDSGGGGLGGQDAGSNPDRPGDMHPMGTLDGGACVPDAGVADAAADAGACDAMFNFEGCTTYGAIVYHDVLNPNDSNHAAFTSVSATNIAACGSGGLAIGVEFGSTPVGGEVRIPVGTAAAPKNYAGKTLTISIRTSSQGTPLTKFFVFLLASDGYVGVNGSAMPFLTDWVTRSFVIRSDVTGGASQVTDISLEAFGGGPDGGAYTGTIYVDEIAITDTPPDGGAVDGPSPDVRDGGADGSADTRDAASGG